MFTLEPRPPSPPPTTPQKLPLPPSPFFGPYRPTPSDEELRKPPALTRNWLPSDGFEQWATRSRHICRYNADGVRSNLLSFHWVHPEHRRAVRFIVHKNAVIDDVPHRTDPDHGDFIGISEAAVHWGWGQTWGVDASGRERFGRAPSKTEFVDDAEAAPVRAPSDAVYAITINFEVNRAWIVAYESLPDAEAERNPIFKREADLEHWETARVWFTTMTQQTEVCIARIGTVSTHVLSAS